MTALLIYTIKYTDVPQNYCTNAVIKLFRLTMRQENLVTYNTVLSSYVYNSHFC